MMVKARELGLRLGLRVRLTVRLRVRVRVRGQDQKKRPSQT